MRVAGDELVQLDDGAGGQFQDVLQRELGLPERDADRQVDVEQKVHGPRMRRGGLGGFLLFSKSRRNQPVTAQETPAEQSPKGRQE